LTTRKFDFGEVEKAMFQLVVRDWKLLFCNIEQPKMRLGWSRDSDGSRSPML